MAECLPTNQKAGLGVGSPIRDEPRLHQPTLDDPLHQDEAIRGIEVTPPASSKENRQNSGRIFKARLAADGGRGISTPKEELTNRDVNVQEGTNHNSAPHMFGGTSLADILKDSRKKFFGIETLKNEQSVLDRYKPVKISVDKHLIAQDFGGDLGECFSLGKRRLSALEKEQLRAKEEAEKSAKKIKFSLKKSPSIKQLETPRKETDLATLISSSIKKMSLIDKDKHNEALKRLYDPILLRRTGQKSAGQRNAQDQSLEDVLRNCKKAAEPSNPQVARQLALSLNNVEVAQTDQVKAHPDERVLPFDEELLKEKECYATEEDKIAKVFKHRSVANCSVCSKPLFNPLRPEKTKSLRTGQRFHLSCYLSDNTSNQQ